MPVVLVNARHLGDDATGYGQYARQLLHAVRAHGAAFQYVFATPTRPPDLGPIDPQDRVRVEVAQWALLPFHGGRVASWDVISFPRVARRLQPAVVHHLAPCLSPALGLPTVTTVHDTIEQRFPRSLAHSLYQQRALRRALESDVLCVVTESARDDLTRDTGLSPGRAAVVRHGCNPAQLGLPCLPLPEGGGFSQLHGHPYFLYLGSDYPHKNLEGLLAAFRIVVAAVPECRLALCGRAFSALRWRRGPGPGVVPVGRVSEDEKAALYQHAVGLVLPSFAEGFGLPVLEALAIGCAVVASDIPAVREIAGPCAVWFSPCDTGSMARALLRVLREPGTAEGLRRRGEARARLFDWQSSVVGLEQAYRSAIAAWAPRG